MRQFRGEPGCGRRRLDDHAADLREGRPGRVRRFRSARQPCPDPDHEDANGGAGGRRPWRSGRPCDHRRQAQAAPWRLGCWIPTTSTALPRQQDEIGFVAALTHKIQDTRAVDAHADVLDALSVAGGAIRAACRRGGTIYLEDSGFLQDAAARLRDAQPAWASPSDVGSFLAGEHEIPDLDGITVVLVGVGDTPLTGADPSHRPAEQPPGNLVGCDHGRRAGRDGSLAADEPRPERRSPGRPDPGPPAAFLAR